MFAKIASITAAALVAAAFASAALSASATTKNLTTASSSMFPLIAKGSQVTVDAKAFASALPARGDVVTYFHPSGQIWLSRIIGMPGDEISMVNGQLHINSVLVRRTLVGTATFPWDGADLPVTEYQQTLQGGVTFTIAERSDDGPLDNTATYIVPAGDYFVMSDNRDFSADSRVPSTGFVPLAKIVGKVRQ